MNMLEVESKFKNILDKETRLSKNSIRNRKSTLTKLLNNMIKKEKEFTENNIVDELGKIKLKTDLSACVNAIRFLKRQGVKFDFPSEEKLKEVIKNKRKNRRKHKEPKKISSIENKINRVRDKNSRVAFKFMLKTGLRVHEVSALKKEDFKIEDDEVSCKLRVAKNNKIGTVKFKDKYLSKNIKELVNDTNENKNVFVSDRLLQKKAKKIGIECHDLRRAYAKKLYKDKRKENNYSDSVEEVRAALRHSKKATTKIYINSKLKM